ncbi:hypothetical protein [Metabacillus fastidiosus]|uniref:hypothetical protein n=1 Tax=Metabacillus fastidiosus TaxID=1458 RepID=UPI0008254A2A|nr:hypothetical protein [Metabacillus fastidiosus]
MVGQYTVGSKDALKAAIDEVQLVLDNQKNKTVKQLLDAQNTLEQAVLAFENNKVTAGDATDLNTRISEVTASLSGTTVGTGVGEVSQSDKEALQEAIETAQDVYEARSDKTQVQLNEASATLDDALTTFKGKVIKAGDAAALNTKISEANTILGGTVVGTGVGQVSQADKEALQTAIITAQGVYDARADKIQTQLDEATVTLNTAFTAFKDKVIKAGDATALTTAVNEAKNLHTNAEEGATAGQYMAGSKAVLKAAIDSAQLVLDNASSKTTQQLEDAKTSLNQAVEAFKNSKVTALSGLVDITIRTNATDSSNTVTLQDGETLVLTSSDESGAVAAVTENPAGTIKVTGIAAGGPITVTAQVKKDGKVIKAGAFKVTTVVPMSIISKTIANLDFSTVYATQAKLVSKPVTVGDFTGNRKDFTIKINGEIIPIYVYWKLSTDFPLGASMGSVVESHIQQYYIDKGGAEALMSRPISAYGFTDTFQISTFQTGSASSFTLEGKDWSYFFEQSSATGKDADTSKNRTFTISDGTNTATIQLTSKFATIDALVTRLNSRLTNANVEAQVEKISETQFKITSTSASGKLIVDGVNKLDFFE